MRVLEGGILALVLTGTAIIAGDNATNRSETEFLQMAASGHNGEIELAKMAQSKAQHDQVKALAEKIIRDHRHAYDELAKLHKTRNTAILAGLDRNARDDMQKLSEAGEQNFDRKFLEIMVMHHEKAEKLYADQEKNAEKDDVRKYAHNTLPAIRDHLAEARRLQTTLQATPNKR